MSFTRRSVSIIINNFNYAEYLSASIETALAQTCPVHEVIVVDDGSTDGSREILQKYVGRLRVVLKENGGQASALNAGFAASSGDVVAFLDSDDGLLPDAMERVTAAWRGGLAKVQFALRIIDGSNQATGGVMPRMRLDEGHLLDRLLKTGRYVSAPTSGNVFARHFLTQVLPIPEAKWGRCESADGYLAMCAPFYGEVGAIRECLGFYRVHGRSMSSTATAGRVDLLQVHKVIHHHMLEKELLEQLASERGLELDRDSVVVSHWMHLKLRIAQFKLETASWSRVLLRLSYQMIVSAVGDSQLSLVRKSQHVIWTLAVLMLPRKQAVSFINMALNTAPSSACMRLLRRL